MSSITQPPTPGSAGNHHTDIQKPSRAPWFVLGGIIALVIIFAAATWESWVPTQSVQVARVIAVKSQNTTKSVKPSGKQSTAFQAAGWVEADPQPTAVTALVSGVIERVSVLDGQSVKAGQEIATLDNTDFKIELAIAAADLDEAKAKVNQAQQALAVAKAHVTAHAKHLELAEAQIAQRKDESDRLANLGDAVSERDQQQAALALQTAEANLEAVHTQLAIHQASVKEREAFVDIMQARVAISQAKLNKAKINLERCVIRAPHDGCIQELLASTGRKQMLGSDNMHSTTVATMYDPASLQVRVDVALDDSAGLFVGQSAKITCNALPKESFNGTVTRILGIADLSRNTLQAKVRIENPSALLRPDMLVKVQFHGKINSHSSNDSNGNIQLLLPKKYFSSSSDEQTLWVVGKDNILEQKAVTLSDTPDNYLVVTSGLSAGMWVVINPPNDLELGQRVSTEEISDE